MSYVISRGGASTKTFAEASCRVKQKHSHPEFSHRAQGYSGRRLGKVAYASTVGPTMCGRDTPWKRKHACCSAVRPAMTPGEENLLLLL
ncbi:hypothetical protein GUJ93_ZPchr0010g7320 [Zizania palustris]|uniref:Uncharacterized protein n=1 Tax=Zizania palustris TaxID=103762 RepID=A0A8J5WIC2_ZIZPA|nr:hypothetical protein GUJ93_ZPchr0010g7320 [Zizania palustris]